MTNPNPARYRELELAWAAGFFDGEGTIYATLRERAKGKNELILSLSISQKILLPLTRFHQAIDGLGTIYDYRTHPKPRDKYTLRSRGKGAREIFTMLEPYLCSIKGDEGRQAIAFYDWVKAERAEGRQPKAIKGRAGNYDKGDD